MVDPFISFSPCGAGSVASKNSVLYLLFRRPFNPPTDVLALANDRIMKSLDRPNARQFHVLPLRFVPLLFHSKIYILGPGHVCLPTFI